MVGARGGRPWCATRHLSPYVPPVIFLQPRREERAYEVKEEQEEEEKKLPISLIVKVGGVAVVAAF